MEEQSRVLLPETEEEYTAWVRGHPSGYVINSHKHHAGKMVWHRACCGHIAPDEKIRYVTGDYDKACCTNPGTLAVWAKQRPERLELCQGCPQE